jgi:hypothetical protein
MYGWSMKKDRELNSWRRIIPQLGREGKVV